MSNKLQPIMAGNCILQAVYLQKEHQELPYKRKGVAGVKVFSPSECDDGVFVPASDVYMYLPKEQVIAIRDYFNQILNEIKPME